MHYFILFLFCGRLKFQDNENNLNHKSNDTNFDCDIISNDIRNNTTVSNVFPNDYNFNSSNNNNDANYGSNTGSTLAQNNVNRPFDLILW